MQLAPASVGGVRKGDMIRANNQLRREMAVQMPLPLPSSALAAAGLTQDGGRWLGAALHPNNDAGWHRIAIPDCSAGQRVALVLVDDFRIEPDLAAARTVVAPLGYQDGAPPNPAGGYWRGGDILAAAADETWGLYLLAQPCPQRPLIAIAWRGPDVRLPAENDPAVVATLLGEALRAPPNQWQYYGVSPVITLAAPTSVYAVVAFTPSALADLYIPGRDEGQLSSRCNEYRLTAQGITTHLIASALTNQGEVIAAQFPISERLVPSTITYAPTNPVDSVAEDLNKLARAFVSGMVADAGGEGDDGALCELLDSWSQDHLQKQAKDMAPRDVDPLTPDSGRLPEFTLNVPASVTFQTRCVTVPPYTPAAIMQNASGKERKDEAKYGDYTPLRRMGSTWEWHGANQNYPIIWEPPNNDQFVVQRPFVVVAGANDALSGTTAARFPMDTRWAFGTSVWTGLDLRATLTTKHTMGLEAQVSQSSPWGPFGERPPDDDPIALRTYQRVSAQLPYSWEAKFNDWGQILRPIGDALLGALPLPGVAKNLLGDIGKKASDWLGLGEAGGDWRDFGSGKGDFRKLGSAMSTLGTPRNPSGMQRVATTPRMQDRSRSRR